MVATPESGRGKTDCRRTRSLLAACYVFNRRFHRPGETRMIATECP